MAAQTKLFNLSIIIILLTSLNLELIGGFVPCQLCLIQRILWLITLFLTYFNKTKLLVMISLLGNIGVSGYQSATQYIFNDTNCPINFSSNYIPCNKFDFYVFNLPVSFALINLILTLVATIYYFKIIKKG
jgi:disulfide bond formation protein DsbB